MLAFGISKMIKDKYRYLELDEIIKCDDIWVLEERRGSVSGPVLSTDIGCSTRFVRSLKWNNNVNLNFYRKIPIKKKLIMG